MPLPLPGVLVQLGARAFLKASASSLSASKALFFVRRPTYCYAPVGHGEFQDAAVAVHLHGDRTPAAISVLQHVLRSVGKQAVHCMQRAFPEAVPVHQMFEDVVYGMRDVLGVAECLACADVHLRGRIRVIYAQPIAVEQRSQPLVAQAFAKIPRLGRGEVVDRVAEALSMNLAQRRHEHCERRSAQPLSSPRSSSISVLEARSMTQVSSAHNASTCLAPNSPDSSTRRGITWKLHVGHMNRPIPTGGRKSIQPVVSDDGAASTSLACQTSPVPRSPHATPG